SRLEFEIFGFLKIESSRTGAESLLSLQFCFVGRHTLTIASSLSLATRSNRPSSWLVEDIGASMIDDRGGRAFIPEAPARRYWDHRQCRSRSGSCWRTWLGAPTHSLAK